MTMLMGIQRNLSEENESREWGSIFYHMLSGWTIIFLLSHSSSAHSHPV